MWRERAPFAAAAATIERQSGMRMGDRPADLSQAAAFRDFAAKQPSPNHRQLSSDPPFLPPVATTFHAQLVFMASMQMPSAAGAVVAHNRRMEIP
jgi:hypothetical protein